MTQQSILTIYWTVFTLIAMGGYYMFSQEVLKAAGLGVARASVIDPSVIAKFSQSFDPEMLDLLKDFRDFMQYVKAETERLERSTSENAQRRVGERNYKPSVGDALSHKSGG